MIGGSGAKRLSLRWGLGLVLVAALLGCSEESEIGRVRSPDGLVDAVVTWDP